MASTTECELVPDRASARCGRVLTACPGLLKRLESMCASRATLSLLARGDGRPPARRRSRAMPGLGDLTREPVLRLAAMRACSEAQSMRGERLGREERSSRQESERRSCAPAARRDATSRGCRRHAEGGRGRLQRSPTRSRARARGGHEAELRYGAAASGPPSSVSRGRPTASKEARQPRSRSTPASRAGRRTSRGRGPSPCRSRRASRRPRPAPPNRDAPARRGSPLPPG